MAAYGKRGKGKQDPMVSLSKSLSYLLRHGAQKEGVPMDGAGYVALPDLLAWPRFPRGMGEADVRRVVETNDKQRFKLKEEGGVVFIAANQGHSIREVEPDSLRPIKDASAFPTVVHGTYYKALEQIKRDGLSRMSRNHIHFATGVPGDQVISGMRRSAEVLVFVDLGAALTAGIPFVVSENGVILTPGQDGYLAPCYFSCIVDAKAGTDIEFDKTSKGKAAADSEMVEADEGEKPPELTAESWILSIADCPFKSRKAMKKAFKEGNVFTGINDVPLARDHVLCRPGEEPVEMDMAVKHADRTYQLKYPETTVWPDADPLPKKGKMRTASDVLNRIKWDPDMQEGEWVVGYLDRFEGIQQVTVERWDQGIDETLGKIPEHRIFFFKRDGVIVWDRKKKIDSVFT